MTSLGPLLYVTLDLGMLGGLCFRPWMNDDGTHDGNRYGGGNKWIIKHGI